MTETWPLKPIRNGAEYSKALERIECLFASQPGSPEFDELEALSILIEAYEDEHHAINPPSLAAAINLRLDQLGMSRSAFRDYLGSEASAEQLLSGENPTDLETAKALTELGIPPELLFKAVKVAA